ncbi:Protein disulfide-isomerase TMX3 [Liparis tanakae]|uniref:protein disulfide-isomerase n=1 Tax=Liparis tanakae TaxID=230148 RepID=A0A4Z2FU36_9TELE|nr:Protein disulfide-isomerase TMX3 [Liparis tanakae]
MSMSSPLPLTEDQYADASLSSWVNKERFQGYLQIDGFTLYELGETAGANPNGRPTVGAPPARRDSERRRRRRGFAPAEFELLISALASPGGGADSRREEGKLVAIAVIDEKDPTEESGRLKTLIQRVAKEYREHFNRDFQFGHMDGNDYINSLIMG